METTAVVNLKGGSGKTTTSVFFAHALQQRGLRVLLIDADPQGSTLRWSQSAEWDLPTIAMPTTNLHKQLRGIIPAGTDAVVIDTPPLEKQAGIVYSAVRAADRVIVPMAPTPSEADLLSDVRAVLDEVSPLRHTDQPQYLSLNRTVHNANSTEETRAAAEAVGWNVLTTEIPRREHFARAFLKPVDELWQYADLADEVLADGRTGR